MIRRSAVRFGAGVLVLQSLLGLAACDGDDKSDAGDARVDTGRIDTGNNLPDEGFPDDVVQDTGNQIDAAADAADAADANTCPSTNPFDAVNYWAYRNRIQFWRSDNSGAGGPNPANGSFIVAKGVAAPDPAERVGDCVFFPVRLGGSVARNDAPSLNFGALVATQVGTAWTWTVNYDTTMMSYVPVGTPTGFLEAGRTINLTLAGGTDGPAANVSAMFPGPVLQNSDITRGTASRTADMVVSLNIPTASIDSNVAMYLTVIDTMNGLGNVTTCAVPACRGRITVPAALMSHYTAGTMVGVRVGLERQVPIPGGDGGVNQTSFVINNSAIQPTPVVP